MKTLIPFDVKLYETGGYDVLSISGEVVKICGIDKSFEFPIIGRFEKTGNPYTWTIDGNFLRDGIPSDKNLVLVKKPVFRAFTHEEMLKHVGEFVSRTTNLNIAYKICYDENEKLFGFEQFDGFLPVSLDYFKDCYVFLDGSRIGTIDE
jgi:hypothetical protein